MLRLRIAPEGRARVKAEIRRITKRNRGVSPRQVLAEYEKIGTGNYTLSRTYTYGEYVDEPLTLTDYTDLGSVSAGDPETFYYHHNRVFHVIGLTDESDDIVELYAYTPYGQVETLDPSLNPRSESAFGNRYLFTGRYLDTETGMFYFRARYFDAELGRFVSRDPILYRGGLNLYGAYFAPYTTDPAGYGPVGLIIKCGKWLWKKIKPKKKPPKKDPPRNIQDDYWDPNFKPKPEPRKPNPRIRPDDFFPPST
jgi:RHS repeat-associated protein